MGIMTKRTSAQRRRLWRSGALAMVALFAWSFIASPNTPTSTAAGDAIVEPPLAAYHTLADAAPIRGLVDHQTYLYSAEPAVARSTSEVSLPSQATSTSWLAEIGILNGLHGTTTGNKVPSETTATQPGGDGEQEFAIQRGTLGSGDLFEFGAGVVRSSAQHSDRPRGYGHAYLANLALLPAPGSPEAPPGSYDPEGDKEKETERPPSEGADDPSAYTPNPKAKMAVLSIGSVASTAETFREDSKVVSIAVAEINGLNIGNRTADGRCTNCITIDSMRVEARTESDGTKEGALASWRILIHRACRVGFTNDPQTGAAYESVLCLDPDADGFVAAIEDSSAEDGEDALRDPNARGVRTFDQAGRLNDLFESLDKALGVKLGVSLRIGTDEENVQSVDPSDFSAAAQARGLVLEFRTSATTQILDQIAGNESLRSVIQVVDSGCAAVAEQAGVLPQAPPPANAVAVPAACATGAMQTGQAQRALRIALGQVRAASKAIPGGETGSGGGGGGPTGPSIPEFPTINIPEFEIPDFSVPPGGGGDTYIAGGGIGDGPLNISIDWSSIGIEPWKPKDLAKGFASGGMALGLWALVRRRLRLL